MNLISDRIASAIVKALRGRPDALLLFALSLIVVAGAVASGQFWIGCLGVVLLYIAYVWRASNRERHEVRMEQLKLDTVDTTLGRAVREKARAELAGQGASVIPPRKPRGKA